jgi:DNA adenine methylase
MSKSKIESKKLAGMAILSPQNNIQSFLRWAGSKRQLIPILSRYWSEQNSRYIEPFVGSGSVFFSLSPPRAILGDVNAELMATYEQVKNNVESLLSTLRKLKKGRRNYLRMRAIDPSTLSPSKRAARFIYLNRFCFNGLYRTNRGGQFNVPYGGERSGKIPSDDILLVCSSRLKNAELVLGSFEITLEKAKPGDFVYMDPPFSVKARRVFNEYDAASFSLDHLCRLREWMIKLDRKDINFLVSYAESEEADFLLNGFYTEVVTVRRNIAGFTANRKSARELLISNRRPAI